MLYAVTGSSEDSSLMKSVWSMLFVALGGCNLNKSVVTPWSCALPPAGFHGFGARDFAQRWPAGIDGYHMNVVKVPKSGAITWNGVALSTMDQSDEVILSTYLSLVAQMRPQPFTVLDFDTGASCAKVVAVRKLMVQHLGCSAEDSCFQGKFK